MPKVHVKSLEASARRYAEKSLMAFLEAGAYSKDHKPKSFSWVIGIIQSSGVRGQELLSIFQRHRGYGDITRFQQAFEESQRRGWL